MLRRLNNLLFFVLVVVYVVSISTILWKPQWQRSKTSTTKHLMIESHVFPLSWNLYNIGTFWFHVTRALGSPFWNFFFPWGYTKYVLSFDHLGDFMFFPLHKFPQKGGSTLREKPLLKLLHIIIGVTFF